MILGLLLSLLTACAPDLDHPHEIAWDHVTCDECGMTLSDPAFAVELVTQDGQSQEFDDPGCAFKYIAERHPSIRHLWFHDSTDRGATGGWLDWNQVGFVPSAGAPMNGGFAAVPVATDGAVSFSEASSTVLSKGVGEAP